MSIPRPWSGKSRRGRRIDSGRVGFPARTRGVWSERLGAKPVTLPEARAYCAHVTKTHYENFTVASLLLPRRLMRHFHAVYAYCRWSDDLADETAGGDEALALLAWWRDELLAVLSRRTATPGHDRTARNDSPIRHPARAVPEPPRRVRAGSARQALRRHSTTYSRTAATPRTRSATSCCTSSSASTRSGPHSRTKSARGCNWRTSGRMSRAISRSAACISRKKTAAGSAIPTTTSRPGDAPTAFRELMRFEVERTRRLLRPRSSADPAPAARGADRRRSLHPRRPGDSEGNRASTVRRLGAPPGGDESREDEVAVRSNRATSSRLANSGSCSDCSRSANYPE